MTMTMLREGALCGCGGTTGGGGHLSHGLGISEALLMANSGGARGSVAGVVGAVFGRVVGRTGRRRGREGGVIMMSRYVWRECGGDGADDGE